VPWINVDETLRYGIVNRAPARARVLHEVAYRRILALPTLSTVTSDNVFSDFFVTGFFP